ncbi:MAG: prolyl oligopeptidase family serine peptidase [Alphaproteobacteria bacterium]|nr:prolyl oligopeptidase family serine peptidase [Alphaproteobacteria bacterium]MBU1512826.1 prolyl oligopeptidase family serine peptidase [Alphaproteobacteria bacterium]MBU2095738.1 prolyl oligopeptidase family serine peptidase [Alphaproteobacteria bacterium]MBU2153194.1 prolyl oligopeptidase family serine peptidase [Alphaproteobacteria bacterium]MBU2308994.1 prolyl oligopeptidase family serine peptidase [Alphaproteobacteria bacterium]
MLIRSGLRGLLSSAVAAGLLFLPASGLAAIEAGYKVPPAPIAQIIEAQPTPAVLLAGDGRTLAILNREGLPSIAAVSEPILRLGGYRINPRTNGPVEARTTWITGLAFKDIVSGKTTRVALPAKARFIGPQWSPDGKTLAIAMEAPTGLELWVVDVAAGTARKLTGPVLNAAFGAPYAWLSDSRTLIARTVPAGRGPAPVESTTPDGPTIQESIGRTAPSRTYQDLLSSPRDEVLFDHYFTSQIAKVDADSGAVTPIAAPAVWSSVSASPDGRFLLTAKLKRPFSYVVPARAFPTEIAVLDMTGKVVKAIVDRPLADDVPPPFDAVVKGPREVEWRADAPATLLWAEALDGGDPRNKVANHDRLLLLDAPFTAQPRTLVDLKERYDEIAWGRADTAIVTTRWWLDRHETRIAVNPSSPGPGRVLISRSSQDRYGDPGRPMTTDNAAGEPVMQFTADGKAVLMTGPGATAKGEYPFVSRLELADGKTKELWRSEPGVYELPLAFTDKAATKLVTRREGQATVPNYYLRTLGAKTPKALTAFADPAPQFAGVTKRLITYKRADGLPLSGTLYLPAGYDQKRDGPLPLLMWAYPAEFTDAAMAGQVVDGAANRFSRPGGISHLLLVTQGYAVLDNPAFPIVGASGKANDTYVEQLTADAQAAVDAVVNLGVASRDRIAVGGHSYGAFMTANLLAHTDLFRTGIARSGAYNRTLTPFGFQAEERTYWEATDIYTKMSPFTYATQIKEPILLMHGGADDNSGTFPVQTERFYAALKGAGATVRYVVLPNEAHGYRARESSLHTLWEMTIWLDTYLKAKPAPADK